MDLVCCRGALAAAALAVTGAAHADLAHELVRVDLKSTAARAALQAFADQTGWQVVYDPDDLAALQLRAVRGEMSVRQALLQLLRGSRLSLEFEEFSERVYICPKPDVLPRQKQVIFRDAPLRPQDTPQHRRETLRAESEPLLRAR